jgi:S-adenosylmethionine hydrolase
MVSRQPIITLTTDFGTTDGYVGAMKGVLLSICPETRLVDITHAIPAQDVRHAALTLWNVVRTFPPDTIHLVVVDPGVGTERRPIALRSGAMTYVAPDNGVLSLVGRDVEWAVVLDKSEIYWSAGCVSQTFHGRDIFSPVAAHLAGGLPWQEVGSPITDWQTLSFPRIEVTSSGEWAGEVLITDHFGNAITNLGLLAWADDRLAIEPLWTAAATSHRMASPAIVLVGEWTLPVHCTYGAVAPGEPLALIGSSGLLEIAVRDGSAEQELAISRGDRVLLRSQRDHSA